MLRAWSLNRKSTAAAMSATSGMRFSALRRMIWVRWLSLNSFVISVSTKPGAIASTVMPSGPSSRASERVKPTSDAFVAL